MKPDAPAQRNRSRDLEIDRDRQDVEDPKRIVDCAVCRAELMSLKHARNSRSRHHLSTGLKLYSAQDVEVFGEDTQRS
jgi:hypothetical protein